MGCCTSKDRSSAGGTTVVPPVAEKEKSADDKSDVKDTASEDIVEPEEQSGEDVAEAPIVRPISVKYLEDPSVFVRDALQKSATFSAEMKFCNATEEDLDKLVDLITDTEPIVLNKDEALVDEVSPRTDKIFIIIRGLFKERVTATESHIFKPGQLYGDFSFFRGSTVKVVTHDHSKVVALSDSCAAFKLTRVMLRSVIAEDRPYRDVEILKLLSPKQLKAADVLGNLVYLKEDTIILRKGDKNRCPNFYIILSGTVEILPDEHEEEEEEEDEEQEIVLKEVGDYFGDFSLVMNAAQPSTVIAYTDVILARIPYSVSMSPAFAPVYQFLEKSLRRDGTSTKSKSQRLIAGVPESTYAIRSVHANAWDAWMDENEQCDQYVVEEKDDADMSCVFCAIPALGTNELE